MAPLVRFHRPVWPLHGFTQGRIRVWHLPLRQPLSRVFWVWEAPALRAYHPTVRKAFLSLVREAQPEKLAALHELGFRLTDEIRLDGIIVGLEGLTENLAAALEVLYRLWVQVPLTEGALRPVIERLVQQRRRAWASPAYRADAYLKKHLWGHTYAVESPLSPEAIQQLLAEEVRRFYEEVLQHSLRHLVIAAPSCPSPLRRWLDWQGDLTYWLSLHTPAGEWHTEADDNAQQTSLRVAFAGLSRSHPDYPRYRLALTHLGGYFGSRLMQEIREKGGYTYGIYARAVEAWGGSYFVVESELDKDRAAEAIQKILTIVAAWADKPFEEEAAFLETRNYLIARLSLESAGSWAAATASLLLHGHTPEWYIQNAEAISELRVQDFEDWTGERFRTPVGAVVVGSPTPIFAA